MSDRQQAPGVFAALTPREFDILAGMVEGLSNREIADKLFVAPSTIKWYIKQIYNKLGVNSRQEAAQITERYGLLADDTLAIEVKHNLPAQTTPFVGRERELDELTALIAEQKLRLVTVLAPGGMGKTRLALEAAEQQVYIFLDGVFFVSLAPLTNPEQIIGALGEAIEGFQFSPGGEPQQQLLDYLKRKQMLLVMDNYEHLLDGAPLVSAILSAAPGVQVLATSRERLNLQGEVLFSLSGMEFPDWETPEDALEYDAVRLFLGAAQRVRPEFQIAPEDLKYLARICRLVGGMPLGVILAAAWVDMYALEQIAGEILEGIDILETDMRDIPDRQRSIRAVFEPTWMRLSADERAVFMRLTVFRGGFTHEAAEQVAGATRRTLRHLFDRALVIQAETGRYDIHELLRQYGEEKLRATDDYTAARDVHLAFYAAFGAQRNADMRGARYFEAVAETGIELDNLLIAWDWACQHPQHYEALWNFHLCLQAFHGEENHWSEWAAILDKAVKTLDQKFVTLALLAVLQANRANWMYWNGVEGTEEALQQGVTLLDQIADDNLRGDHVAMLSQLSWDYGGLGNFTEYQRLGQRAIRVSRARGWQWETAVALIQYVSVYYNRTIEGYDRELRPPVEALIKEASELSKEIDNKLMIAWAKLGLANVAREEGNLAEAKKLNSERLPFLHDAANRGGALFFTIWVSFEQGEYHEALDWCEQLLEFQHSIGLKWNREMGLHSAAKVLAVFGRDERAVEALACLRVELGQEQFERWLERLKNWFKVDPLDNLESVLTPAVYAAAVARGQATDPEDMIALLLNDLKKLKQPSDASAVAAQSTFFIEPLTERELDVLRLLARGQSNQEIAEALVFTVGTVKWYLHQIYGKLHVGNRTQAVAQARELKLII